MPDKQWQMPGTSQEDSGPLKAFGFGSLPATRITAIDPFPPVRRRPVKINGAATDGNGDLGAPTSTGVSPKPTGDTPRRRWRRWHRRDPALPPRRA